jgi:hypothetical protein
MNWFKLILKYLPTLLEVIVAVEGTLKTAPGPVKKAVVLDILNGQAPDLPKLVDVVADSLKKNDAYPVPVPVVPAA